MRVGTETDVLHFAQLWAEQARKRKRLTRAERALLQAITDLEVVRQAGKWQVATPCPRDVYISAIKAVRQYTGLGLREAVDAVRSWPGPLDISADGAEALRVLGVDLSPVLPS